MNMIIEEEVLVPDIPIIEEQVLYPDNPISVEEEVLVPAIVQKPKFIPDPSWGNLDECPDNDIWFVVTDDKPTTFEDYIFVQYSSFNVKSYKIDWGDGSEIYTAIAPTTTNITNHKYLKGTGRIDTNGREFWIMKVTYELHSIDYPHYIYPNGYVYVNYPQKIFNIAPYKYIVFGKNLRKFEFSTFDIATFPLEAIKFLSDTIDMIPSFPYNKTRLKYILHAGDTLKLTKLIGYRFMNGVCQDLSDIQIEGGEFGEYLWGCENQTRGKVDLSKMKVSSDNRWSHCFYGTGQMVEEVIMPQEPFTGTYVRNCFYNCISLRKLVLPKSMPNVEDALGFLQNCKQLYDFELPSDFGSKGNGLILTMQYVPKTMRLDLKNTKIRCLVWSSEGEHSSIGLIGLTFSSESPFDYQISNAHLYFQFAPLSYDAIIEIFNQLPNFKGESVRVININGCAGTSELTEEDIKIATDKNWQVIGV